MCWCVKNFARECIARWYHRIEPIFIVFCFINSDWLSIIRSISLSIRIRGYSWLFSSSFRYDVDAWWSITNLLHSTSGIPLHPLWSSIVLLLSIHHHSQVWCSMFCHQRIILFQIPPIRVAHRVRMFIGPFVRITTLWSLLLYERCSAESPVGEDGMESINGRSPISDNREDQ
jgi:hypothetical protein